MASRNKPDADITKVIPALDMDEVRRFAAERGVRLWLWLHGPTSIAPLANEDSPTRKPSRSTRSGASPA